MVRVSWAAPVLVIAAVAGCSSPCGRLADRACEREGEKSRACQDVRRSASRAGDEEQGYCRTALAVISALPEGPQRAGNPDSNQGER